MHADDEGARLMLAWRAGEDVAFDRLVELHSGQVWALVSRFMGRHPGREDLVQEVFLRVVRARERYQPTARFTTWLYRIVFNLCVNETQRGAGREAVSLDGPMGTAAGREGQTREWEDEGLEGPSERMERADLVGQVRAAIAALPEKQRMALILAKYDEMPYVEIGVVLGASEKAVKSLVHRAREGLRELLAPLLEEELA
jgi:RNA polymerase sigma-70 factor (ECF subfamily)